MHPSDILNLFKSPWKSGKKRNNPYSKEEPSKYRRLHEDDHLDMPVRNNGETSGRFDDLYDKRMCDLVDSRDNATNGYKSRELKRYDRNGWSRREDNAFSHDLSDSDDEINGDITGGHFSVLTKPSASTSYESMYNRSKPLKYESSRTNLRSLISDDVYERMENFTTKPLSNRASFKSLMPTSPVDMDEKQRYKQLIEEKMSGSKWTKKLFDWPSLPTSDGRMGQRRVKGRCNGLAIENGDADEFSYMRTSRMGSPLLSSTMALDDFNANEEMDLEKILTENVDVKKRARKSSKNSTTQKKFDLVMNKYSHEWMNELTKKCQQSAAEKNAQIELELAKLNAVKDPNNKRVYQRLTDNFLRKIWINEPVISEVPDVVEEETVLPKFTPEQEMIVNQALRPHPGSQVLIDKFKYQITRQDIQTLNRTNWLNDEIINIYMNLIVDRNKRNDKLPKVHAMATFFFPKLQESNYDSVRRWTKKVDIFAHDLILVPVHLSVHWCMCVIDFRNKQIRYFDSMGSHNKKCTALLLRYLIDEMRDKKKQEFDTNGWTAPELSKKIPQQANGSDCGVFACTFAEYSSRNAKFTFSQDNMPYLRRKMVLEIVTGGLIL